MAIAHVTTSNFQSPLIRAAAHPVSVDLKVVFLKRAWKKVHLPLDFLKQYAHLIEKMPSREFKLLLMVLYPSFKKTQGMLKYKVKWFIKKLKRDRGSHHRTQFIPVITKCGFFKGSQACAPEYVMVNETGFLKLNTAFVNGFWWTKEAFSEYEKMQRRVPTKEEATAILLTLRKIEAIPWRQNSGQCSTRAELGSHFVHAMGVDHKCLYTIRCDLLGDHKNSLWTNYHKTLLLKVDDIDDITLNDFVIEPSLTQQACNYKTWMKVWAPRIAMHECEITLEGPEEFTVKENLKWNARLAIDHRDRESRDVRKFLARF